ncbi:glycoside hydrolase family 25 protein [Eubacteriales bacterium KG127]
MKLKYRIRKNKKLNRLKYKSIRTVTIGSIIAALLLITFIGYRAYLFHNKYGGLGEKIAIPPNSIDMSSLKNDNNGYLAYDDGKIKSKLVIDVSEHNGEIDWSKVKASGIYGAIIRVGFRGWGDGRLVEDSTFTKNLQEAKANGIEVGVYFFSQAITTEEAIEEAEFVMKRIWGKGVVLPVVFDMENNTGKERFADLSVEEKTEITDAFLTVVKKFGYDAAVYGNPDWFSNNVILENLGGYSIWLAHYNFSTNWPYEFKIWQFTDKGRVKGIHGNTDLNLLFE